MTENRHITSYSSHVEADYDDRKVAAQHVHQVFSETLAAPKNMAVADARIATRMGGVLLLLGEAQRRNPYA